MNVGIRVDGSKNIGMGHIMRCISLARSFKDAGSNVFFISKYQQGIFAIEENGFNVKKLSHDEQKEQESKEEFYYGNSLELEEESEEIIRLIEICKLDVLIIDSYNVTEKYFLKIKPYVKILVYIDDVNAFPYPVDVVINGNITGKYLDYKSYFKNQKFLLGPSYNLIRDEFKNISKRAVSKEVKKIMITTGGSDPFRTMELLIDIIRSDNSLDGIEIHGIIGVGFNNKEELKEKQRQYKNIVLHENVVKMSEIMLYCDIALSSCGSTLYELCACGTPVLGFVLADNQEFVAKKMDELGYIKFLGWYHQLKKENVNYTIKEIIHGFETREEMVKRQQGLVDGNGTKRVVNVIREMLF